ncbi:uncharacterized protein LOC126772966 [Nymphalis io]|uniref:uncharacterized protein LOC126772966 n=1 Tax=Inachis io TaxID=171585 RepID=UPI0021677DB8|nr:uncharacterized protein LOC126772966 [Nymphalis io]
MKYLLLGNFESKKNIDMSCDTSIFLNKEAKMFVANTRFPNLRLKNSKRYRSAFTTEQINYLENEYKKFPYIKNTNRKEVANKLKISEKAVKIWFQNRRMKEKREVIGNKELHIEDENNIYNTFSKELLNGCNMPTNNFVGDSEALLSNQTEKSKVSTIKKPKDHYQIRVTAFINDKISNNKHNRTMDLTKDKINLNILKSTIPSKLKSETTKLLTQPLKITRRNKHFNDVSKEHNQKSTPIHCFNKKETEVGQDLIMSNIHKKEHQQCYSLNSNIDQRFMSLYTQGYYASPHLSASSTINSSNIIWKPVNVMPMPIPGVATCSPFSITHNCSGMSSNNQDVSIGTCSSQGFPHWLNGRSQCLASSQSILAFSNSSNKI